MAMDYMTDEDVDYYGDYEDDDMLVEEGDATYMSITDIFKQCLEPTLTEAFGQVAWMLCACLALRLLNHHLNVGQRVDHILSVCLGLVALVSVVGGNAIFTIVPAVMGYFMVSTCAKSSGILHSQIATIVLVCYLVVREYVGILPESWEQVRGIQMIIVMKILSLCFDMGIGYQTTLPSFDQYLGYIFCPANLIFGPWIPFDVYCRLFEGQTQTIWWVLPAFGAAVCSFLSLGVSSCLLYWVFLGTQSRWLLTFRDAMAVRFSHYFISYLSELSCLLTGIANDSVITVTEPWRIEMPRSLVDVVVCWNKPMHRWLRVYIFRPSIKWGTFQAVLWTFAVSSMLHGLNFGLTSVLLSLGLYTYVEHTLREKLATIFNACIRSRKCPANCSHTFKSDNFTVFMINVIFGLLAIFNLAYLGVMISKSHIDTDVPPTVLESINDDLKKWKDLNFLSHVVMLCIYLASLVI